MQRMLLGWGRGETWPRDFTSGLYRYRLFGEDSKELGNEHVVTVVVDFMTQQVQQITIATSVVNTVNQFIFTFSGSG